MTNARDLLAEGIRLRWGKDLKGSAEVFRRAIDLSEEETREAALLRATCTSWLGVVLSLPDSDVTDLPAALELHKTALRVAEDAFGGEHVSVAESLRHIGDVLEQLRREEEAFDALERSVRIYTTLGIATEGASAALVALSSLALALGRFDAAADAAKKYLTLDSYLSESGRLRGHAFAGQGLLGAGRAAEAIPHFERALEISTARGAKRGIEEMQGWLEKAKAASQPPDPPIE